METTRERRALRWILVAVVAIGVAAAGWHFFAPKPSQTLDEVAPAAAEVVREGAFRDGETFHKASGSVQLLRQPDGSYVLHFEDYEATPGPDVFFYLTKTAGAGTTAAVEGEGIRLPTDTPRGQATLRGAFNVAIPAGVDPTQFAGISVWCDSYNVLFGWADITTVPGA